MYYFFSAPSWGGRVLFFRPLIMTYPLQGLGRRDQPPCFQEERSFRDFSEGSRWKVFSLRLQYKHKVACKVAVHLGVQA